MKEQFSRLIDVKTIVTFIITLVLAYLAVIGRITPDQFMVIAVMIFTYFFTKAKADPEPTTKETKTTTETTISATTTPKEQK